jgi:NTP pyrophosphatase (non-canonical NTP hydrolase)
MLTDDYIAGVLTTESNDFESIYNRMEERKIIRLLHAFMGMSTEAGEALDAIKKHLFYGKELDEINLIEELGDALWYISVAINALGTSYEQVMERNLAKLKKRYGEKFNEQSANNRNLDEERKILECCNIWHQDNLTDKKICPDCKSDKKFWPKPFRNDLPES